jgi:hypothetical protein
LRKKRLLLAHQRATKYLINNWLKKRLSDFVKIARLASSSYRRFSQSEAGANLPSMMW